MSIERINNINNPYDVRKAATTKKSNLTFTNDNIEISEIAKEKAKEIKLKADVKFFTEKAVSSPTDSARTERLNEIKAKLINGDYNHPSKEVLDKVAENLYNTFFAKSF